MPEEEIAERLHHFLKKRGLRQTEQRDEIVREAFSNSEHFTAEELFERVKKTGLKASRATIYRTLALLVDAGLLGEIDFGDGVTTYDPNCVHRPTHNHLLCVDCGRVLEFEDDHLEVLNQCLSRRLGFRAVKQTLRIEAGCEQLRQNGHCPHLIEARISGKRLPRTKR